MVNYLHIVKIVTYIVEKLLSNRKFVLLPLNDIAPLFLHPILNLNTKELIRQSNDKSSLKRIDYKYIGNENKI